MILTRSWIVRHEFTVFEFGAFDPGGTYDVTFSPWAHRRFHRDIRLGQSCHPLLLPTNASSFLDSHSLFHENKPDLALYCKVFFAFTISFSCFLKL